MKKLGLLLIMLVTIAACQKDYYLEDLNDAQAQIERLEADKQRLQASVNELTSDLNSATANVSGLQTELAAVMADYEAGVISLEEANALIQDLQDRLDAILALYDSLSSLHNEASDLGASSVLDSISVLAQQIKNNEITFELASQKFEVIDTEIAKVIGVQDGIYRRTHDRVYHNQSGTWTDWNEVGYTQTGEFIVVSRGEATEQTKLRGFLIEQNPDTYAHYTTLGKNYNSGDVVGVTRRNEINTEDTYTVHFSEDGGETYQEEDQTIQYLYEKVDRIEIEREDYPFKTREELKQIFTNLGVGFYSDPLYASLNYDDIYDFERVFIADAKRHGLDMSWITGVVQYRFNRDDYVHRGYCATGGGDCAQTHAVITYAEECWGDQIQEPFWSGRLDVMYHEYGHAVMHYPHPQVDNAQARGLEWPNNVAMGFGPNSEGRQDIMGYAWISGSWDRTTEVNPECITEYSADCKPAIQGIAAGTILSGNWNDQVDRFFAGTDHTSYCNSAKGNVTKTFID